MECCETENNLTDVKIWKPIVEEMNRILEQREIFKLNVNAGELISK